MIIGKELTVCFEQLGPRFEKNYLITGCCHSLQNVIEAVYLNTNLNLNRGFATDGYSIILRFRMTISASYIAGKYFKGNIVEVNIPCVHIIKIT